MWMRLVKHEGLRIEKDVGGMSYESEERGIVLCIAPIFVPFDEASIN